jgi:hypothetical protein
MDIIGNKILCHELHEFPRVVRDNSCNSWQKNRSGLLPLKGNLVVALLFALGLNLYANRNTLTESYPLADASPPPAPSPVVGNSYKIFLPVVADSRPQKIFGSLGIAVIVSQ